MWGLKGHEEILVRVEVVKDLHSIVIVILYWITHRSSEVVDMEGNVSP
jgi:hypothetical protein